MMDLIETHLTWCRAGGLSHRTVGDRGDVLRRADRALPLGVEAANEDELTAFFDKPHWKPATKTTYFQHLWAFYVWAEGKHLDINPMENMRRPSAPKGTPRPIPHEKLNRILTEADNPFRFFAKIAAYEGLRCKEIAGLYREDVTPEWTYIREAKGGRQEKVPTHEAIWEEVRGFPSGSIPEYLGGVADAKWVSQYSSSYFKRALHMPRTGLHSCRHWYATELRKAGHDLFKIQRLMRHRSIVSTQIYVDVPDGELRLAVGSLPVLAPATR